MIIIGVDFHPEFQQIASVDTETGEFHEKRLTHPEEAKKFYRALAATGQKIRAGMEASGHARWFERLLAELQIELWIFQQLERRDFTHLTRRPSDCVFNHRQPAGAWSGPRSGFCVARGPARGIVGPFQAEETYYEQDYMVYVVLTCLTDRHCCRRAGQMLVPNDPRAVRGHVPRIGIP